MRLIDADALWEDVIRRMDWCSDVLDMIEGQPTVDAVEVVKCKDCRHYYSRVMLEGYGWCNEPPLGSAVAVSDDFFCGQGKRKNGGEEDE